MAARFWVGGTGNWSSTTHWSTLSGGAGGSAVPTSADTVTLDANSGTAAIVTVDVAANAASVTINKSDITLKNTLGLTVVGAVTLTAGTLNTNGQAQSWGSFLAQAGTGTITFGASAITITGAAGVFNANPGLTITANTAIITFSNVHSTASISNLNWNGLSLTFSGVDSTGGQLSSSGATLKNLTVKGVASTPGTDPVFSVIGGNLTLTGTLTAGGNTVQGNQRLWFHADFNGGWPTATTRTITCAAVVINGDVIFSDITIAGSPTWTNTGSSFVGDAGGNSGQTFTVAATQSWQTTSGGTWSTNTNWTSRVPLPQDNVIINKAFIAAQTITADMIHLGKTIDFTGTTGNPTFTRSNSHFIYGSLVLVSTITLTGNVNTIFSGRDATYSLTNAGRFANLNGTCSVVINSFTGGLQFADTFVSSNVTILVNSGTFSDNSQAVTARALSFNNILNATITLGTGNTWTLMSNITPVALDVSGVTLTFNPGTASLIIADTSVSAKTFAGGGHTFYSLSYPSTSAGSLTITSSNTFTILDIRCSASRTITLPASGVQTVTNLTLQGAGGATLSLVSSSVGTATNITAAGLNTNAFVSLSSDVKITSSHTSGGITKTVGGAAEIKKLIKTSGGKATAFSGATKFAFSRYSKNGGGIFKSVAGGSEMIRNNKTAGAIAKAFSGGTKVTGAHGSGGGKSQTIGKGIHRTTFIKNAGSTMTGISGIKLFRLDIQKNGGAVSESIGMGSAARAIPEFGGADLITSSGGRGSFTRAPGNYGEVTSTYLISAEVETPTLVGAA